MPLVDDAFRAKGLKTPTPSVTTVSIHVRSQLLATGRFVGIMPGSGFEQSAEHWQLRALPVGLGVQMPPVGVLKMKNRTTSPAVGLFLEQARLLALGKRTRERS
jgi:DNA-binding transcriptional LysR family regulator